MDNHPMNDKGEKGPAEHSESTSLEITGTVELEELKKKIYQLEKESRFKNQLITNISYQIRSTMNGVLGIIELLENMDLSDELSNYVKMLKSSSSTLGSMMEKAFDHTEGESPGAQEAIIRQNPGEPGYSSVSSPLTVYQPYPVKKPKTPLILVVEDNEINKKLAVAFLSKGGYHTLCAGNGYEAVEAYQKNSMDLILMDIQMPEMNGFDATFKIRELEKGMIKRIPIIAMTAYAMTGDREKCLAAGMDDYISKPISSEILYEKIRKHLQE